MSEIKCPFTLPVKYDERERVIVDARGLVIYDPGRWLEDHRKHLAKERALFLVQVLNAEVALNVNPASGIIEVEEAKEEVVKPQSRNPWGRNGKPK